MRVRAIDRDGTSPNHDVTYTLKDEDKENFQIDEYTGEITTKKEFDREAKDVYQVTVIARDGAPSALRSDGKPNERKTFKTILNQWNLNYSLGSLSYNSMKQLWILGPVTLKIEIADKNDNEPRFNMKKYEAEISEDADINNKVIEVKAVDNDTGIWFE